MHTHLSPKALKSCPRDHTLLIEVNDKFYQSYISRMRKWEQITQYPQWNLQDVFEPEVEEPPMILQIVEYKTRSVDLQFIRIEPSTSIGFGPSTSDEPSRISIISHSNYHDQPNTSFQGVKFGRPIPQLFYSKDEE